MWTMITKRAAFLKKYKWLILTVLLITAFEV